MISAYPDAAIILSTRPEDAWHKSMMTTLVHHHTRRPLNDLSPMAPLAKKYHQHCWGDDFAANGISLFRSHNEAIREASKGRKFLEYEVGSGWAPLCEFLGVEIPDGEFPRSDDWVEYKKMVEQKTKVAS